MPRKSKNGKVTGYVSTYGDHILEKGDDPFVRPSRVAQRRTRRLLMVLAGHYLVPRQQQFFDLYFLHGRTPQQISTFHARGCRDGSPVMPQAVCRRLRRIRWILERAWAFFVTYRLHKKLRAVLTQKELDAMRGYLELNEYRWKGAPPT